VWFEWIVDVLSEVKWNEMVMLDEESEVMLDEGIRNGSTWETADTSLEGVTVRRMGVVVVVRG